MAKRRQLFELLTKSDLVKISRDLGFGGWSVLSKAEIVNRLSRKRSISVDEILAGLRISELRSLCLKLELNPGGQKKQTLIDRITGKELKPSPPDKKCLPKNKSKKKARPIIKKTTTTPITNKQSNKRKPKVAPANGNDIENRLWAAADKLWANTGLSPSQFSTPVLGLIFLRYAESKFKEVDTGLKSGSSRRRQVRESQTAYQAKGAVFLPEQARFSYLQNLPEGENLGKAINDAMKLIEENNEDLRGVLPKTYNQIQDWILVEVLRLLGPIEIDGDAFGKVYEYFLGKFALAEGRKGGVFYTPTSIVRLIVEILEPYYGKIFDPACGSGGMFVQSAKFVERQNGTDSHRVSIYGAEKESATIKLSKMNLAIHGLAGDIVEANSYYEDPHKSLGKFDFVMANPPFNMSGVDKERIEKDPRFKLGLPNTDNANYLWIQIFFNSLNEKGRAGFVISDSASDARGSEKNIRKLLIQKGVVDVVVAVATKFFYTVTGSCMLWFFDRSKENLDSEKPVLFIDARHIYNQLDRAHREWTPLQIEFLANIVRLKKGKKLDNALGSMELVSDYFPDNTYQDVQGLCKKCSINEIESKNWSLNPTRYVGLKKIHSINDSDFDKTLRNFHAELQVFSDKSQDLHERIRLNDQFLRNREK